MVYRTAIKFADVIQNTVINATKSASQKESKFKRLPPLPSPRELLKLYRIHAQRNLSQNFLLDKRLNNKIVTTTGNISGSYVCEVGPGPGNITRHILQNGAAKVTVVEKDHRFLPTLQLLADACNQKLEIIMGDIMDLSLQEMFPKEFGEDWSMPCPPFYIIGNLPFNVSTPLIIRWMKHCANHSGPFTYGRTRLTLTFQKEVANRMIAEPGSDFRCRLSIMCQYLCNVEKLFTIPGRAFFPKPEVDVSVVKFTPLIKPQIEQPFSLVEKVARTIFHNRQKYSKSTIKLLYPEDRVDLVEETFNFTKIPVEKPAYHFEMEEFCSLCNVFSKLCEENEDLIDYDFRNPGRKVKAKLKADDDPEQEKTL